MTDGAEYIQMNPMALQLKGTSPGEEVLTLMEQTTMFQNETPGNTLVKYV